MGHDDYIACLNRRLRVHNVEGGHLLKEGTGRAY